MPPADNLQDELAALRRELQWAPVMEDDGSDAAAAAAASADEARSQIEHVLHDLQARLTEVADDAGELVAENPLASVAAAFLLGVVAGSLLMRSK